MRNGLYCLGCKYDYNHCHLAYDWCVCKTCNEEDAEPP
jgi:hypothetical protein